MKNIITIIGIMICFASLQGQVAIEKEALRSTGSIMEFNDQEEAGGLAKGIILPVVSSRNGEQGTIIYDETDNRVKYRSATQWIHMTESNPTAILSPTDANETGTGTVVTDGTFTESTDVTENAPGVLVLNAKNKALTLPVVNDVIDVPSPEPGTMVYEKSTKSIAVFNGEAWYLWN